jgi:small-conductance mechanosensitive channel
MERRVQSRISALGIQSAEVARAEQIRAALRSILLSVRVAAFAALALAYIGYTLGQWPATRALSRGTFGLALDPLRALGAEFVGTIPQLAFLAVLYVVLRMLLRVLHLLFDAIGRGTVQIGNFDRDWAQPTYKIVRLLTVAFGLVVAYPYIPGSSSEAFKGVSLFMGIVFSIGSSSAISNIVAGYMMTYRRAFKVGDFVQIGSATGAVIGMRLQVTHLRNYRNEEIIIPNSQILTTDVVNFSSLAQTEGSYVSSAVGIGYGTSWRRVETILLDAAARTPGLVHASKPFVLVKGLGDFAVTYELNTPLADPRTRITTTTLLNRNVLDVFNEHGVQVMTPAYEADPPEPKVVPLSEHHAHLPATAPPIRPETVAPGNPAV